jgi:hypothetical protein
VALIVVLCAVSILVRVPHHLLPASDSFAGADLFGLVVAAVGSIAVMAPLDFLGGYLLPTRFQRQTLTSGSYFMRWLRGISLQTFLFILSSLVILTAGRAAGLMGAVIAIVAIAVAYLAMQGRLVEATTGGLWSVSDDKVQRALNLAAEWGLKRIPVRVVRSSDPGFTGGVVGLPTRESIVIARDVVDRLTCPQLAIILARRMYAVESGSRTRGILVALFWICSGVILASQLPGAEVTSVAGWVTTCLGFTIWLFLALLTLPTISRQSSYAIDHEVLRRGAGSNVLKETLRILDQRQDDEPSRSAFIETIFHPVPSVDNRQRMGGVGPPLAWHAARMTLFLSWSCMGTLARAVHCNVGRPELWVMLPTD